MFSQDLRPVMRRALDGHLLLEHPFYRRWEAGALAPGELAAYAGQYRHIEAALPMTLGVITAACPDGEARRMVDANLSDELGTPAPHLELFDAFAFAVGATGYEPPTPATEALIGTQIDAAERDATAGLAALAAYEVQAAEIATTKANGLRRHYRIPEEGVRFWDVHAAMEEEHADWSLRALAELADGPDDVSSPARAAAQTWWAFLDEREASKGKEAVTSNPRSAQNDR
jgi:pyrroloquinoline quinone (PQQ) biosynthesis protein C